MARWFLAQWYFEGAPRGVVLLNNKSDEQFVPELGKAVSEKILDATNHPIVDGRISSYKVLAVLKEKHCHELDAMETFSEVITFTPCAVLKDMITDIANQLAGTSRRRDA